MVHLPNNDILGEMSQFLDIKSKCVFDSTSNTNKTESCNKKTT